MMKSHLEVRTEVSLKEKVERIIDEGTGRRRNVIVRLESSDSKDLTEFLDLVSKVASDKIRLASSRDLMPPKYEDLVRTSNGRSASSNKRLLSANKQSMAAALSVRPISMEDLSNRESRRSEKLLKVASHDLVMKAASEINQKGPVHFWTSDALLLDMHKDDLNKIYTEFPDIQDIHLNRTIKIPRLVESKSLPSTILDNKASSWGIQAINALAAWGAYGAKGKGVTIGLLDTGVDFDHPDLKGKMAAWAEFDVDGRPVAGSKPHDSDQHGTHCAGTIVGGNASGKWIGVAPEAKLAAALVLKGGAGSDAQILAGLQWAIEQKVDIISMSLGGLTFDVETPSTYSTAIVTALMAGIPVVAAIGNEGPQTTGEPGNDYFAFSVGATDHRDLPAGFSGGRTHLITQSNYIPARNLPLPYFKPEVSAPGVAVLSSIPCRSKDPENWYATFNGTSMATPHVAGAMALLLSATNNFAKVPADQRGFLIREFIASAVEELGESGWNNRYGYGRIDVLRAIGFAKEQGY
jgi:Subtilase family